MISPKFLSIIIPIFLSLLLKIVVGQDDGDGDTVDISPPSELEGRADSVNGTGNVDLIVEPPDLTKDKEVICDAIQKGDADIKVDITGMMDYDDLLRLTVWNNKYTLRNGFKKFFFKKEVNWKRNVLAKMGAIFTNACPREFVNPEFINAALELFMIYQNSWSESWDHTKYWNALTPVLDKCLYYASARFDMTSSGFELTGIKLQTSSGTEVVALMAPEELADSSQDIDVIIDTIWWLFSFTFGNCYWQAENPSFWAARYKRLFYADFLKELKSRWLHAGPNTEFGVIFGDFNFGFLMKNMRICVTAAYTKNGLADRQLVRSLTLAAPSKGIEAGLNKKLGKSL